MAKYTGSLTDKQKEMLAPLEKEVKDIMRKREFLRKKLAFIHDIGFEDHVSTREEIEALDTRHGELSEKINKIYGAHAEMMEHMRNAIEEVKIVDEYCKVYGFEVRK